MGKKRKPSNNKELEKFYNFLETKLTCLDALGRPVEQNNQMLFTLIYRQLPSELKKKVSKLSEAESTIKGILDIINTHIICSKRMDYREASSDSDSDVDFSYRSKSKPPVYENSDDSSEGLPRSSGAALPVVSRQAKPCPYCNGNHSPVHCHVVTDVGQRSEIIKTARRCFNCLLPGHRSSDCSSSGRCRKCRGRHHTSLCNLNQPYNQGRSQHSQVNHPTRSQWMQGSQYNQQDSQSQSQYKQSNGQNRSQWSQGASNYNQQPPRQAEDIKPPPSNTGNAHHQGVTSAAAWESGGSVLLQLAEVEVRKPHGTKYLPANLFLDHGSQMSYCIDNLKEELDLDVVSKDVLEVNTFGTKESRVATSNVVKLQILKGQYSKEVTLHTTPLICSPLPSFKITKRKLQELGSIKLAHPRCKFEGSHEISILIGADLYWEFVGTETISTSFGARAVNSKFGWLLSGTVDEKPAHSTNVSLIHHISTHQLEAFKLDELSVDRCWLNNEVSKLPQMAYLDKMNTVLEEKTETSNEVHTLASSVCNKKSKSDERNKISATLSTVALLAVQDTYHCQENESLDEVEEEDSFKYKVAAAIRNNVELSWFWETEHIGIIPEEKEPSVLEEFEKNIKFIEETQRYEVKFPYRQSDESLPDNYHICEVRLNSLLERLNKPGNEDLLHDYNELFKKQESEGIIEEVSLDSGTPGKLTYLPHHLVIRRDSPTSAKRVVYDGSAKSHKKSISLNQKLHPGENLVADLPSILVRFRMFSVGLVADIRKAFLQISLAEEDRDVTRFLWREDGNPCNPIKVYRFTRVPFGLTSSPFLLHATLRHHLQKNKEKYPETILKLLKAFYVDDMVTGADTEEDTDQLAEESEAVMKDASMELAKWNTNSVKLSSTDRFNRQERSEESFKVLGITWDTKNDEFSYKHTTEKLIHKAEKLKPTKRTVLKVVSSAYDPLGFISPFLITAKILLQKLCKSQLGWDELLPEEMMTEWRSWVGGLQSLKYFTIPRCINLSPKSDMELVGFCDASMSAYAAVIYLRCSQGSEITSRLVMSRSRVAPMKAMTIARLELLGAVLLARLMSAVLEYLSYWKFTRVSYYTDSKNVLYWITGDKKIWNDYISKRLEEINIRTLKHQWYHCPGEENSADLPTRGVPMGSLSTSLKWLQGPSWLTEVDFQPNREECQPIPSQECLDEEKKKVHTHVAAESSGIDQVIKLENYSTFKRLCHQTACFLSWKFYKNKEFTKTQKDRLIEAEKIWIKNEQKEYYSEQIPYLKHEKSKPRNERSKSAGSVAKQLDLFMDEEEVLRLTGRYKNSTLNYQQKYPILLPKESHLTKLIVEDRHKKVKHAGVKTTLTEIREEFWIPSGRRMVGGILRRCVICRRLEAQPFQAPGPPPLPHIRLSEMPPFTNTGVDFAGPIYCRERGSSSSYKSYIALFTCASTRAVSLELVPDMTAHAFKNAMIRFVSNWGVPHVMVSDNAKTFEKSARDLNALITRSPNKEFINDNRITWLFYLEKSPWWGGFIERMVGSVKSVLRKCLYRTFMNYDDMTTLLKEISSVINSRPITYIYEDEVEEPLTPSHLLIGKRSTQLPPADVKTYDAEGRSIFREKKLSQFTKEWKKVFLSELQDYHISMSKSAEVVRVPKIGEPVIMKEATPRSTWKLARVTNIFKSADQKIRSIEVIKPNGKIARRPPQLLIPLEYVNK